GRRGPGRIRRASRRRAACGDRGGAPPVDVIATIAELGQRTDDARAAGGTGGLVPTMGFFPEGHLSLMRRAPGGVDPVRVGPFVNGVQLGPNEDVAGYPRDMDRDLSMAEAEGVDLVFAPSGEEMYPDGQPRVTVDPGPLADRLEGAARPGHFRGVLTVVAKL